ncbi:hypothetical protein BDZ94DRAFT_1322890 [Collybia nuda]|uniref:Arrestin-like N-terminal domain-containing protein n=1 Tax=Collybia nuda TaxID=64659 RepID=A0A9P5Y4B4_9AGAR|nr:hypothetical protein BDZ94DRAFT_1322890 [Collybia nuda]
MSNSSSNEGYDGVTSINNNPHTSRTAQGSDQLPRYSWVGGSTPILPRYSMVVNPPARPGSAPGSSRSATTIHEYNLKNGKIPWVTLKVSSRAGPSSNHVKFVGGDTVTGSVILDLNSSQTIKAIYLTVRGRIITGSTAHQSYTFLDYQSLIWSKAHGDPRHMSSGPSTLKFDGKIVPGEYTWPFSFSFPTESTLPGEPRPPSQHRIPNTFRERGANVSVLYDLTLHIIRGKLRADDKIRIPVVYIPKITPEPFSHLRQLAYRENTPLPDPIDDPEGWLTLPAANIRGVLFQRAVELDFQLSIAKPLCYTQGTVVPCSLTVRSMDIQALDILVSPKTVGAVLKQRVKYFPDARQFERNIAQVVDVMDVGAAIWWSPNTTASQGVRERRIEGEIHLPKGLQPSSDFAALIVEYAVHLLPPKSPIFCVDEGVETLPSQLVSVGTIRAPGPTPREHVARPPVTREPSFDTVPVFMEGDKH